MIVLLKINMLNMAAKRWGRILLGAQFPHLPHYLEKCAIQTQISYFYNIPKDNLLMAQSTG